MAGFLDKFRHEVIASVWKDDVKGLRADDVDDKIALGVLLWVVAEADERFLPEEEEKIKNILISQSGISVEKLPVVLASIRKAADERIDLYVFTSEISKKLSYVVKMSIIEDLFRVACADEELDNSEIETIRKISGLLKISHKDFIEAKIKVKKEVDLGTDIL